MMTATIQQAQADDIRSDIYEAIAEYTALYHKVEAMPDVLKPVWNRVLQQYRMKILASITEMERSILA
jgi:hypothetical protein